MLPSAVEQRRPALSSATDWLPLSPTAGRLANGWAARGDLLVFMGPDRGGSTALCDMIRGQIEINTDFAFNGYTLEEVLRYGIENFRKFAVATGALYHEAMHARHTPTWINLPEFERLETDREFKVLKWLEEPRIEYYGIMHEPDMQRYLRATGLRVTVENGADKKRGLVDQMPLSLGRVIGGSVSAADVEAVRALYVEHLGEETVAAAEDIMRRFIHTEDGEHRKMVDLAKKWCETVPEDGLPQEIIDALMRALQDAAVFAGTGAASDMYEDDLKVKRAERDRERAEKNKRKADAQKAGNRKRRPTDIGEGYGTSRGVPFRERPPTSEERSAAVRLAAILARIEYTDKKKVAVDSIVPPGKLHMNRVVANRGARAAGGVSNLPEWEMTRQEHVDSPTLRVGLIVDVSGSMKAAMKPMAVTGWVLYAALQRIQAKSRTVYMGEKAYSSKQNMNAVQVWDARAGTENFTDAKALLDAELDLTLEESGARLAVVVSDGRYMTPGEKESCMSWMRLLKRQGVTVLWLGYSRHDAAEAMCDSSGAHFVPMTGGESPVEVALTVGDAAVRALREKKL